MIMVYYLYETLHSVDLEHYDQPRVRVLPFQSNPKGLDPQSQIV